MLNSHLWLMPAVLDSMVLDDLIQGLNLKCYLYADYSQISIWTSLLNSRLRYPGVYLTSLLGYLICISNLSCSPRNLLFPISVTGISIISVAQAKNTGVNLDSSFLKLHVRSTTPVALSSIFKIYPESNSLPLPWSKLPVSLV